ncbi:MAG TPA: hypothetical protein VFL90_18115 [Methylomirabilota bacterium]|nr:hypothetical protein [Methylomirabilota bacterium]
MKPALAAIAVVVVAAAVAGGAGADALAPGDLIDSPERYDGRRVVVKGRVLNVRTQSRRKGEPYYTFELQGGGRSVLVLVSGRPFCRAGATATVDGLAELTGRGARATIMVDAMSVTCPPPSPAR